MKKLNKDFYTELPSIVCEILEDYIKKYKDENWFNKAWEEYRQHILDNDMDGMKMPAYVFDKYIKKED